MTPFTYRGGLYTVAGYPGADWAANARAAGAGTLSRGRKSRQIKIVELDAEESRPVLREFAAQVPVGVGFAKRSGLVRDGTPDEFEALAGDSRCSGSTRRASRRRLRSHVAQRCHRSRSSRAR